MSQFTYIGKSVKRRDGVDKTTGRGLFTTDIYLPGMLYAKVLRSPHPHAKIVSIDTSEAEKFPGVKAVMCHKNGPRNLFNWAVPMFLTVPSLERVLDQYLFDDVVRHVGDEVAAVAATSEAIAEEALKLIKVEYELLPAVYDPLEALKEDAPELHAGKGCTPEGKNIPGEIIKIPFNDVKQGFADSDVIVEDTFSLPIVKQVQMETHASVAQVDGNGDVTVWSTSQTPHPTRSILAKIFDVPASKIRVLAPPYVGGRFRRAHRLERQGRTHRHGPGLDDETSGQMRVHPQGRLHRFRHPSPRRRYGQTGREKRRHIPGHGYEGRVQHRRLLQLRR